MREVRDGLGVREVRDGLGEGGVYDGQGGLCQVRGICMRSRERYRWIREVCCST